MRRNGVLGLLAALAAFLAALSYLRRGRREAVEEAGPDPRAEELRRTLAEARRTAEAESSLPAEASMQEAPGEPLAAVEPRVDTSDALDAERRRVHEAARRAVEEMRAGAEEPTA